MFFFCGACLLLVAVYSVISANFHTNLHVSIHHSSHHPHHQQLTPTPPTIHPTHTIYHLSHPHHPHALIPPLTSSPVPPQLTPHLTTSLTAGKPPFSPLHVHLMPYLTIQIYTSLSVPGMAE